MRIEKKPVRGDNGVGGCNDCDKGKVLPGTNPAYGLVYPYEHVYEIHLHGMVFRLCKECLIKLGQEINKALEGRE
jgi:hypothetical protein